VKIDADREACIGSGLCALTAPKVFEQSAEDGLVLLVQEHPEPAHIAAARMAVERCPSGALSIDENTG